MTPGSAIWFAAQPIYTPPTVGSRRNLGAQGVFRSGYFARAGAGRPTGCGLADDGEKKPVARRTPVPATLRPAPRVGSCELSPDGVQLDDPDRLAFPLRRGLVWRRRQANCAPSAGQDLLLGSRRCSPARCSGRPPRVVRRPGQAAVIRGDEVELHRRLVPPALPSEPCLDLVVFASLRVRGRSFFFLLVFLPFPLSSLPFFFLVRSSPLLPTDPTKPFFTYRNRGYVFGATGSCAAATSGSGVRFGCFLPGEPPAIQGPLEWISVAPLGCSRAVWARPPAEILMTLAGDDAERKR